MNAVFPIESLPLPVRQFVMECSTSLPCSVDLVALPALVMLGAAIGNSRTIRVKQGWEESASIYAAVIADTGSVKSPALGKVMQPMVDVQTQERRTWTSDTTTEKLAELHQKNPHGIAIVRDELLGWARSCNQYRDGKGGDREFYLSAWSGMDLVVDRKSNEHPLIVKHPFLSVLGCLPPDRLDELEGGKVEDGFLQRFLLAWPEPVEIRWSDEVLAEQTLAAYHRLVKNMYDLDWQGQRRPLNLSQDAQQTFRAWHDNHFAELRLKHVPHLRGFYAKLKGYCARLALIHAIASESETEEVSNASVRAAIEQIEYFKGQAARVAAHLSRAVGVGTVGSKEYRVGSCRDAIVRGFKEGRYRTRRDAQRLGNHKAEIFGPAWDSLVQPLRLIEDSRGGFSLLEWNESVGASIGIEEGTDIPTTDTTGESAA